MQLREHVGLVVADERRRVGRAREVGRALRVGLAARARDRAVLRHPLAVVVDVDRLPALLRELDVSSSGKPYVAASVNASSPGDRLLPGELLEDLEAALERLAEPLLLGPDDPLDLGLVLDDFRVPRADLLDDDRREAIDALEPDAAGLHDGASDEPPQDVPASLVRGNDAFGDEERHPAPVVAEHAMRLRRLPVTTRSRRRTPARSSP